LESDPDKRKRPATSEPFHKDTIKQSYFVVVVADVLLPPLPQSSAHTGGINQTHTGGFALTTV
jgi:hypothetical protein